MTCTSHFVQREGSHIHDTTRYATSLRPLRPFARIIRFRKPQAQFLVQRLREICDRESLLADMRVLSSLVEVTSGDVRSCLNTLQVGIMSCICSRPTYAVHQMQISHCHGRSHPMLFGRLEGLRHHFAVGLGLPFHPHRRQTTAENSGHRRRSLCQPSRIRGSSLW